ncbi:helix-turn-helix domain-containing protein [Bacillus massilinigeriensis]|uniref:helix-turn-helix domain-containing protein n=1 Tax=Bacillus massilionigeriensis TaxID=1805475 RepID=UPI0028FC9132|nr:RodZ domain-containing protein [Bacillus massilionigeriensis]
MLSLSELGNRLKEARINKNMSLDDLQSVTKIQKRYLKGIEEGNYDMMPGSFYVRAFIKQYAEAVGIEPEELFSQYASEIPATHTEDIPEKISRVQSRSNISPNRSKIFDILPKILIAIVVIGVIAAIYYYLQKNAGAEDKEAKNSDNQTVTYEESEKLQKEDSKAEEKATEEETTKEEENPVVEDENLEESTQEISILESNGDETTYELKNAEDFQVKIVSTGETWINMLNGKGYSFFQGTLKKGETDSKSVDYSKEEEAVIIVGNAANTEIYVNDQLLEYKVSPSEVVTQNITIKKVSEDSVNE